MKPTGSEAIPPSSNERHPLHVLRYGPVEDPAFIGDWTIEHPPADRRRQESAAALEAASMLRAHAHRAQERLDALPVAPSEIRINPIP